MRTYDSGAVTAYYDGQEAVTTQIADLLRLLQSHRRKAMATDPYSWGWAGDMEHVSAQLGEIIQYLGGEE